MLAKASMKKKKLGMYFIIIFVMLGGTSFLIYKNYTLTSVKKTPTKDIVLEGIGPNNEEEAGLEKNVFVSPQSKATIKRIINLELLSDPKFRNLKENFVESGDAKPGKRNPFAPY